MKKYAWILVAACVLAVMLSACKQPTQSPSDVPTQEPTSAPTSAPTVSINTNTPAPTTPKPTDTPTPTPTSTPTPANTPTAAPTATAKPTAVTTTKPAATATLRPTATATPKPVATATATPVATTTPTQTQAPTAAPTTGGPDTPTAPVAKGTYTLNGSKAVLRPATLGGQTLLPLPETCSALGYETKVGVTPLTDGTMQMTLTLTKDGTTAAVVSYIAYEHSGVMYARGASVVQNGASVSPKAFGLVDGVAYLSIDFYQTVFGMSISVDASNNVTATA